MFQEQINQTTEPTITYNGFNIDYFERVLGTDIRVGEIINPQTQIREQYFFFRTVDEYNREHSRRMRAMHPELFETSNILVSNIQQEQQNIFPNVFSINEMITQGIEHENSGYSRGVFGFDYQPRFVVPPPNIPFTPRVYLHPTSITGTPPTQPTQDDIDDIDL
jgi:hypothetical protein